MKWKLVMVPLAALAAGLACSLPFMAPTPIPVSTEAAGQLVETLTSITPGPGGEVSVTLTQEQLTSYVALELEKTPEVPITQPQIILDDGLITLKGTMDAGLGLEDEVEIQMQVVVGADGKPDVTITSAQLGPLPVPPEVLEGASTLVSEALAEQIDSQAGVEVNLTSLAIDDGVMSAAGTVQQ